MKRRFWILTIITAVFFGVGAFWATTSVGQNGTATIETGKREKDRQMDKHRSRVAHFLGMDRKQMAEIYKADPNFFSDSMRLRKQMHKERETLAKVLEDIDSSDQAVMQQVDKVVEIHSRLERRVAGHLLKVRGLLTPKQRKKLFKMAAKGVRSHHPKGPHMKNHNDQRMHRPDRQHPRSEGSHDGPHARPKKRRPPPETME